MRSPNIALMIAVMLLVSVASSATMDSKMATPDTVVQNGVPTTRFLRTQIIPEDDDEERGGIDTLKHLIKSATLETTNAIKLRYWVRKETSANDVMTKLKFNEKVEEAIASANLKTLSKYVKKFNKKYPTKQISVLGALTGRYGDDVVAEALVAAKKVESTKDIATKLQKQQLEVWLNNKKSVGDVFKILKLGELGPLVMDSRKLETLGQYVKLLNSKTSEKKISTLRTLSTGFGGDAKFAVLLAKTLNMPGSRDMYKTAYKYQNALFQRWEKSELTLMDVIVKMSKVDEVSAGPYPGRVVHQYKDFLLS